MSEQSRKYAFDWNVLGGNMQIARPGLGGETRVEVYRLFQFTLRDILEQRYGTQAADAIFLEAGILAGREFFKHYCAGAADIPSLAKIIQEQFRDLGIGIVRFEVADPKNMTFQLTVDEDLDCSGLPDSEDHICIYDEGFIKGILDSFTGKNFSVQEIDCWCSGARTCRFKAVLAE
ncbi:4-vinyl reductase, 4VR [uncultured delta proteobacterium]|uniref:4-vinyl reductase, 4VR n=1 Tax=uncultured delta proteobacterium TaxID=34034 RepID=A0A212JV90_9DELT|nr:4-vinyl reductase, 4VR [uncultured delta proteobacterium]